MIKNGNGATQTTAQAKDLELVTKVEPDRNWLYDDEPSHCYTCHRTVDHSAVENCNCAHCPIKAMPF